MFHKIQTLHVISDLPDMEISVEELNGRLNASKFDHWLIVVGNGEEILKKLTSVNLDSNVFFVNEQFEEVYEGYNIPVNQKEK